MKPNDYLCTLNLSGETVPPGVLQGDTPYHATRERLALAFIRLRNLELLRVQRNEALFGKCAEDRLIWRELLELELQAVDEDFERRRLEQQCAAAGVQAA